MATTRRGGATSITPCRKRAPPTPPARTVTGLSVTPRIMHRRDPGSEHRRAGRTARAARRRAADRRRRVAVGAGRAAAKAPHEGVVALHDLALRARHPDRVRPADPAPPPRPAGAPDPCRVGVRD